jgi:hypothetical protein
LRSTAYIKRGKFPQQGQEKVEGVGEYGPKSARLETRDLGLIEEERAAR